MTTFSYNGVTITLPSPDFDDQLEKKYRRVIKESRGKDLIIYPVAGYSYLNAYETVTWRFSFLSEIDKQMLINFLDQSLGQPVSVVDYNNVSYFAIIVTPSAEIINDARNSNQVTLELEITS